MIHTKPTIRINIQINQAESALDALLGDISPAEKQNNIDTIRLALKIFEHKILRIKELENQIEVLRKLRDSRTLIGDVELIQEIANLDRKIEEYQNTIQMMQEQGLPQTGT